LILNYNFVVFTVTVKIFPNSDKSPYKLTSYIFETYIQPLDL